MKRILYLSSVLLVPVNIVVMLITIFHFSTDYSFTNATRLGVLFGFYIGIVATLLVSTLLIMFKSQKKSTTDKAKKTKKKTSDTINNTLTQKPKSSEETETSTQTLMLLMNAEIIREIILHVITEEKLGSLTQSNETEGEMTVTTKKGKVSFTVQPLTKHSSKVLIDAKNALKEAEKTIHYLKEKELSFLKY